MIPSWGLLVEGHCICLAARRRSSRRHFAASRAEHSADHRMPRLMDGSVPLSPLLVPHVTGFGLGPLVPVDLRSVERHHAG
jgi:hypothetical protein